MSYQSRQSFAYVGEQGYIKAIQPVFVRVKRARFVDRPF